MSNERIEAEFTVPAGVAVSATNSGGGPTSVTMPAGTYFITTAIAAFVAALNATRTPANWSGSLGADGRVTLNCTGTWSLTWTSTILRDLFGFTANVVAASSAQTGDNQAKGLWIPNVPIALDSDPKQAPKGDDGSSSIGPTGRSFRLKSTSYFRHRNVRFSHVVNTKVWANIATFNNESWETFYLETQSGGHDWFKTSNSVAASVKVYWNNAGVVAELGNGAVQAWTMPYVVKLDEIKQSVAGLTALLEIELGDLYADG